MRTCRFLPFTLVLVVAGLVSDGAAAQQVVLRAGTLSAGGTRSTGSNLILQSTVGQAVVDPDGGAAANGAHVVYLGFWHRIANDAAVALPAAADDVLTTDEDRAASLDVVANDTNPAGGDLTLVSFAQPAHGGVTQAGPSTLRYTPEADYYGPDAFTYTVRNVQGGTATATVAVTVHPVNDIPVITSDAVTDARTGQPYRYDVAAEDADTTDTLVLTAPLLPAWLTLTDHGDGTATLEGTPLNTDSGAHDVQLRVFDGNVINGQDFTITVDLAVATEDEAAVPEAFALDQNYPNPFNPTTTIRYALPQAEPVHLAVYDLHGRLVETLVDAAQAPGRYAVTFDAADLASGVYLYRLRTSAWHQTRYLVLVK